MSEIADHFVEVEKGQYVFREGDLGTEMYVIHRGSVEILKRVNGADSGETVLAVFEQGDFFGELSLLDDQPRSASVRALEDSVLVEIDGATFIQMLRDTPEIAVRMMRKLSRRLRHTDRLLQEALDEDDDGREERPAPPEPRAEPKPAQGERFRLVAVDSGEEFVFGSDRETLVGRADPVTGIEPAVDLTAIDTQRSCSRRHARLFRRGGRLYVVEEVGSMNGTFVNGRRLDTGVPVAVEPGDVLRFGVLKLELQAGDSV